MMVGPALSLSDVEKKDGTAEEVNVCHDASPRTDCDPAGPSSAETAHRQDCGQLLGLQSSADTATSSWARATTEDTTEDTIFSETAILPEGGVPEEGECCPPLPPLRQPALLRHELLLACEFESQVQRV